LSDLPFDVALDGYGMRSTVRSFVVGCVAAATVGLFACTFISQKSDGSACGSNDDCKSKICTTGYCGGSSCKSNGDCESGWTCHYDDGILGFGSSQRCLSPCNQCANGTLCPKGSSPDGPCIDPRPHVTIDQPAHGEGGTLQIPLGRPITFHATATSPTNATITFEWIAGPQSAKGDTATFTFTSKNGISVVQVMAVDDTGQTATDSIPVTICAPTDPGCPP